MKQAERAASLLAQIYETPDSDELRMVYGDLLIEMGDPRGEFIGLQMQPKRSRAQGKRESALLAAHRDEWLGPLAELILKKSVVFERGFLACAALKWTQRATQLIGHPAWATVARLDARFSALGPELFCHSSMRSLRVLEGVLLQTGLAILDHEAPLGLEELGLERAFVFEREPISETEVVRALGTARGTPALKRLTVNEVGSVIHSDWLLECPLGRRLDVLRLAGLGPALRQGSWPQWTSGQFLGEGLVWLLAREARPRLTILSSEWTMSLQGRHLEVEFRGPRARRPTYPTLVTAINALAGASLDSLRFAVPRWLEPTPHEHEALAAALASVTVPGEVRIPEPDMRG